MESRRCRQSSGEFRDQGGAVRVAEGAVMPDSESRSFDWFVEGVVGKMG